ncbi:MAG: hypothetical protein AAB268_11945 [Elusimicrobiota bacterium]
MTKTLLLLSLGLLSACVAETVERRRPRKGPVKEVDFVDLGGGNIRYSTDGWSWFVAGRRRHALRLMRKNCGKKLAPQILDEYMRQDADIPYVGEDISTNLDKGMEHFKIAPFEHLVYECRAKGEAYEAPLVSTAAPRAILIVPPVAEASMNTAIAPVVSTATIPQEPPK